MRLWEDGGAWHWVKRSDERARALVDGETVGKPPHYSRQTPGADEFMSNGKTLVLMTDDGLAVWGAIENMDPAGKRRWRVSIFRNKGPRVSSELVAEATDRTFDYWRNHYRCIPSVPLQTEVDPTKVRRKRDPGRCFLRAGWRRIGVVNGLVVLQAPTP